MPTLKKGLYEAKKCLKFYIFLKSIAKKNKIVYYIIRAIREMEPGQDRKIAALTFISYVHFLFKEM